MNTVSCKLNSHNVKETMVLGRRLAGHLKTGDLVALVGIFGAGKTYFTKGIARGLGVKRISEVISPSFTLCNIHKARRLNLYHFDVQRLPNARELLRLGFTDAFIDGVCVVEWADKWTGLIKFSNVLRIEFKLKSKHERLLEFRSKDKRWLKIMKQLRREVV